MTDHTLPKTPRSRGRRYPERVHQSLAEIRAALDAAPLAHIGYLHEGLPFVTPTFHWVSGDAVYWHGATASRAMRASTAAEVCLTVTTLDGYVLARSAFHHSANYRSVMVFGKPRRLEDKAERLEAMRAFMDRRFPGRWTQLRDVSPQELKLTTILCLPITEASVKARSGPPQDDAGDLGASVWAGVVPVSSVLGKPIADLAGTGGTATGPLPVVAP